MRSLFPTYLLLAAILVIPGCTNLGSDYDGGVGPTADYGWSDASSNICAGSDTAGDYDSDGITNGEEGCLSGRDTDGDHIPDWQDFDSDNDKINDSVEKGAKNSKGKCVGAKPGKDSWPCDTDGDHVPDYLDLDSDGDQLRDGAEDANGDGLVGCCLEKCNKPDQSWQLKHCILDTKSKCGKGQSCVSGTCTPPVSFKCSEGETSPRKIDTMGDGKMDNERGTFICRDATEDKPQGRKAVQLRKDILGDWHIAIEKSAIYGPFTIAGATKANKLRAAAIDHSKSTEEAAGFIISRATTTDVQTELSNLIKGLKSAFSSSASITVRASGTQGKSHDLYDTVRGTILDIKLSSSTDVSTVRNELVAGLLGKQMADLKNVPSPFGSSSNLFVVRFTTVRRFVFKKGSNGKFVKDAKGYPVEDPTKTSERRLLIMGAVAASSNYQNPKMTTGFIVDDLSNGTAVAVAKDSVGNECDVGVIIKLPKADIIWVIDESGSMNDNRADIVNNANNFFSRALASGLDFRMGVTNVCTPNGSYKQCTGKFCSVASTNTHDSGGVDRFLLPSEQTTFGACIKNPPCYEGGSEYPLVNAKDAVTKHLPRATNDPTKIRTGVTLVIIAATDEVDNGLQSIIGYGATCPLPASKITALDQALQPYLNLFTGVTDPEGAAMFHVIGGVCNKSGSGCSAAPNQGL